LTGRADTTGEQAENAMWMRVIALALVIGGAAAGNVAASDNQNPGAPPGTITLSWAKTPPSPLAEARRASPILADIVEEFAMRDLGESEAFAGTDLRTQDIVAMATLAALGDTQAVRRHAEQALKDGASRSALKEVLYLTAVYAGLPKAIAAAHALSDSLRGDGE
jgi:alkylhydroperoxidase/carboxymuconolactone decarboxylase family protein YurZ